MKFPLITLALLITVTFAGTADAGDPSPHQPIKINCGDPVFKHLCDTYCSLSLPRIMAGPLDWLLECAQN